MNILKKFILAYSLLGSSIMVAQEKNDSCYVYGYLHWSPSMTKYTAKIQLGPDDELTDIVSKSGDKLKFKSFLNALNYMSMEGWEVIEISPRNPDQNTFTKEQYAIIRKFMTKSHAKKYSSPKE